MESLFINIFWAYIVAYKEAYVLQFSVILHCIRLLDNRSILLKRLKTVDE
jgi:hypothetical protein